MWLRWRPVVCSTGSSAEHRRVKGSQMTPAREALASGLTLDGHSDVYVSTIGYAARFTRLRRDSRSGAKTAEYRGRMDGYIHVAALLVHSSHGLGMEAAEKLVRKHVKEWDAAISEDEQWLKKGE